MFLNANKNENNFKKYPQPPCMGLNHECTVKSHVRGFRGENKKEGFYDSSTGLLSLKIKLFSHEK
jgi:hypothetical protein